MNRKYEEEIDRLSGKKNTMGIVEQVAEIKAEAAAKQAAKQARAQEREKAVRLFLSKTDYTVAQIAEMVGVAKSFVERIKGKLSK